jgi:hypothetical protein
MSYFTFVYIVNIFTNSVLSFHLRDKNNKYGDGTKLLDTSMSGIYTSANHARKWSTKLYNYKPNIPDSLSMYDEAIEVIKYRKLFPQFLVM